MNDTIFREICSKDDVNISHCKKGNQGRTRGTTFPWKRDFSRSPAKLVEQRLVIIGQVIWLIGKFIFSPINTHFIHCIWYIQSIKQDYFTSCNLNNPKTIVLNALLEKLWNPQQRDKIPTLVLIAWSKDNHSWGHSYEPQLNSFSINAN
jgi:hypothetical protein